MRAMLVEAAVAADLSKGEVNAALAGVGSLAGVLAPLAWATMFGALAHWGRGRWYYNPGGTWVLSALGRVLVLWLVPASG